MSVVVRSAEQMEDQPLLPQLIQRHGALLLRLAQRQVGPEAAQELTQQTLAWLAERQKDWAQLEEAPLAAYLAAAVQRQSAALRRQVQEEQSWRTQPTEELACPGPSLEEQAILAAKAGAGQNLASPARRRPAGFGSQIYLAAGRPTDCPAAGN